LADTDPLEFWQESFGDDYTDRNAYADWKVENGMQVFGRILAGLQIESVLEVGSNIGINLLAPGPALSRPNQAVCGGAQPEGL
jgi:hypothetical protein